MTVTSSASELEGLDWGRLRGGGMLTLKAAAIGGGAGGGRGGLRPHDGGEGALLFDCRNHMDRRE